MNDTATAAPQSPAVPGRSLLIVLGMLNVIFGLIAMGSPMLTGTAVTVVIGIMLLGSGVFELIHAFQTQGWKIGFGSFVSGVLAIAGGGLAMARPVYGMAILTLILAFYFIIDGVVRISQAFSLRLKRGWVWVMMGGIVTTLLGFMIWRGWPLSGLWAVGILIGVRILMSGWTMLLLGLAAGRLAQAAEAQATSQPAGASSFVQPIRNHRNNLRTSGRMCLI